GAARPVVVVREAGLGVDGGEQFGMPDSDMVGSRSPHALAGQVHAIGVDGFGAETGSAGRGEEGGGVADAGLDQSDDAVHGPGGGHAVDLGAVPPGVEVVAVL